MVSSGTVSGDLNTFSKYLSNYSSEIEGLSPSWKGTSYDSLISQANAFISEYANTVNSQLSSLASACDVYSLYATAETNYNAAVHNYNTAAYNNASNLDEFQGYIDKYSEDMNKYKKQILDILSSISTTLTATSNSSSVSAFGVTSHFVAGQNPDLIYSTSSGYVFPFEKGVDAPVTSSVGYRNAPTAGASSNHKGTDIGVPIGTPIHSLSSGTVLHTGAADGYGQWVQIQQDDGMIVTYGHISKYDYFSEGDRVNAGDVVALSGNEGISTGPHLHLQIEDADGNIYSAEDYFEDCWPA